MINTICRSVCARISSDNSGEDIFLPRSSSKITTSSGFSRRNIASDSSWIAPARSFDEFGRMTTSTANGALRRSQKRKIPGSTQDSCFFPTVKMVCFIAQFMAERGGFEPPIRCRIHDFESCAFNHSATSPAFLFYYIWQMSPRV